jgi:tellurite resistance protein
MTGTLKSQDTSQLTLVWLRGLITIAWADGHFDLEEQDLIATLTQHELTATEKATIEPVSPTELAATLGSDPHLAENFLRTAVMVALADHSYSESEDALLQQYSQALGTQPHALDALRQTFTDLCAEDQQAEADLASASRLAAPGDETMPSLLHPVKDWLDQMEIHDPKVAHFLCKVIPPQCPFERDVVLFGRKIAHIPAMCKLNPLYEQLVGLRFRALSYLADECGEDVTPYC